MELKDRLKSARTLAELTQDDVAVAAGITQPGYARLEAGKVKSSTKIAQIAKKLGVSVHWLATGEGPMHLPGVVAEATHTYQVDAPDIVQRIPIIGWDKVQEWLETPFQTEYSVPIWRRPGAPARVPYSESAFALMVENDRWAPELPAGTALLIDPEAKAGHKGWVLVRLPSQAAPTLLQAVPSIDPDRPHLKSVLGNNAPAEPWPSGAALIGPIVYLVPV